MFVVLKLIYTFAIERNEKCNGVSVNALYIMLQVIYLFTTSQPK